MEEEIVPSIPFNETYRRRTKEAALRVIRLFQQLPRTGESSTLGKQLLRSATSVAANFRAACRGRSGAEWYAKLCICVEEADETLFWLELLGDAGITPVARLADLQQEYREILAVLATARKKARK
ncbi:four helix bundle protein [Hymenobacter guriensis]|uniref:Four helix bundle protein n=1 Tax=Hymenobacter guriensis TaxID=2793065 RepID=A0ABS0L0N1_9BACT|nr:four helix bundle protein [Hymenobacter guriensis]MBG8553123.1 four helix bundle protein [Hymenobacter guriensis]